MGTLDANGIYLYDEEEPAAPGGRFSGLLNKLAGSVSNAVGALTGRMASVEQQLQYTAIETTGILTAASGWELTNTVGIKLSGLAFISANAERTGSAIEVPNHGNLDNTDVADLQPTWTGIPDGYYPCSTASAGRLGGFYITGGSKIRIGSIAGVGDIITGDIMSFTAVYPLA